MENVRKPIRRLPVFLSRISGDYPRLTFSVEGHEVPFRRGRICLEGDDVNATEIQVAAEPGAAFVPLHSTVPVSDGKVFVELVPADALSQAAATSEASDEEWEEVPAAEYFDDDDVAEKGSMSRATIWVLSLSIIACVAVLIWFFFIPRAEPSAAISDSDSVKADTVQTDTARADTAKTSLEESPSQAPASGGYAAPAYTPSEESAVEEEPAPKRRELPEGTDLATEHEH